MHFYVGQHFSLNWTIANAIWCGALSPASLLSLGAVVDVVVAVAVVVAVIFVVVFVIRNFLSLSLSLAHSQLYERKAAYLQL